MFDIEKHLFTKLVPIEKGCSGDRKFYAETAEGERLLLRVSDIREYERKRAEYDSAVRAVTLGISMSAPVDFGICCGGECVYSLMSWCDGADAEHLLPMLGERERYCLGEKAGHTLARLHTLPAPDDAEAWSVRFARKVEGRLAYIRDNKLECNVGIFGDYLETHNQILLHRPQCFAHGDYNVGNLMVTSQGDVAVIDFNCYDLGYGDPFREFCAFIYGTEPDAQFYTGMINAYFCGDVPDEFFRVLTYYCAYDAIAAICESAEMGDDLCTATAHGRNILRWFDNFRNPIPTWYLGRGMM